MLHIEEPLLYILEVETKAHPTGLRLMTVSTSLRKKQLDDAIIWRATLNAKSNITTVDLTQTQYDRYIARKPSS